MKQVTDRDFKEQIDRYLYSGQALAVKKDGATVGYYLPVPSADNTEFREALTRLEQTVKHVLEETGMGEDELADLFDLTRPFPMSVETSAMHASGR